MTVQESTICSLIQTFPVLLILAQNHNRCVKTPLIYKPPSPTHSPEYYQALDALIHNLYGHGPGNHHDSGYHDHDPGYLCYGYHERKYSEYGHSHPGYGTPCYNYGYVGTSHGFGHEYPHNFGHYNHGQQHSGYGFKKINMYNGTGGYGVKGYAPNQVYNVNHKYKVVVKRNKVPKRRRFHRLEKLTAGVFESQPREERRYSTYGFSQNDGSRHDRFRNKVSSILHLKPEDQNSNPSYIYPFDKQRRISSTGYYDQYGNYQQNQNFPGYDGQNYNYQGPNYNPQGQNCNYQGQYYNFQGQFCNYQGQNCNYQGQNCNYQGQNYNYQGPNYPDYGRPNYQQAQNYPNNGDNNNGNPVRFPTSNKLVNKNDPTIVAAQEVPANEPIPEENIIAEDKDVNFPLKEEEKKYDSGIPEVPLNTAVSTLPPLTPVPSSEVHTESPPFPPLPNDPAPAFTSPPSNVEIPAFKPDQNNPLQPVESSNPDNEFVMFKPEPPQPNLPPLQPVESSNPDNGFSMFKPEPPQPNLPPLQPVESSNSDNGFSMFKPEPPQPNLPPLQPVESSNPDNGFSIFKPESPQPNLPPLQPVESSNPNNGFSSFKPVSPEQGLPPLQPVNFGDQTTLPPLTPVPASELRNNFDFGPAASVFQAPCQTVDGELGSCVSLYDCQPYFARLQHSRSDPNIIQILRRAHCGFDGNNPKVCCPRPGIPTAPPEIRTAPPTTTTTTTPSPTTTTTSAPKPTTPKSTCLPETYSVAPEDKLPSLPEPPVCGLSNASFSRVVGGVDAHLGDFPFMALLGYRNKRNSTSWLCGGSLITSKHVLTAAHCIKCREHTLYVVRVGELDLSREDEGATPVDILIKTHVIHQDYSTTTFTNDIGLLVLQSEVQFTPLIKPVCLPRSPELRSLTFERYTPMLAGWGDLHFRGPQSQLLQILQLPVVSNADCKQSYVKYKSQVIDERVLCAGYKLGGRDACQGDSGGPLMQPVSRPDLFRYGSATYFYQIGVVSYGYKCAEPNFPGVYTRVTYFIPWLEEQLLSTR